MHVKFVQQLLSVQPAIFGAFQPIYVFLGITDLGIMNITFENRSRNLESLSLSFIRKKEFRGKAKKSILTICWEKLKE
jgi:hypothetical protein